MKIGTGLTKVSRNSATESTQGRATRIGTNNRVIKSETMMTGDQPAEPGDRNSSSIFTLWPWVISMMALPMIGLIAIAIAAHSYSRKTSRAREEEKRAHLEYIP